MPLPADAFQYAFSGALADLKKLGIKAKDVDSHDRKRGTTLLYTACRFGHFRVVRYLVELGADVNKAHKDNGSTPLHGAAYGGHREIVAYLMGKGADVAACNTYGETPLDNAKEPGTGVKKTAKRKCMEMLGDDSDDGGDEDNGTDESEDAPPEPPKKKAKLSTPAAEEKDTEAEDAKCAGNAVGGPAPTKLLKKGKGIVDPQSYKTATHHVVEEGNELWQCTLNQTNIAGGQNNNKYYIIQLLAQDGGNNEGVMVFMRWGRVGTPGATQIINCQTLAHGKAEFCKKFKDKTKNAWADRENFVKHGGKYHLMDMVMGGEDDEGGDPGKEAQPTVASKLPPALKRVMELISNKKAMEATMKELELNTEQLPLGKISKKQLSTAAQYLRTIEEELQKTKPKQSVMEEASQNFYTLVPHDYGMGKLPVISTMNKVKQKTHLLEVLGDLVVTETVLKNAGGRQDVHPLDAAYEEMHCEMEVVDKASEEFKKIAKYVQNTHGPTHNMYRLELEEVFRVDREGETKAFEKHAKNPNRMMLWHGSGNQNWVGILSQGLRIAPPEAPHTGYMFGKGIYFADCATKSANYCRTNVKNNVGFMSLNEVALGKSLECTGAKYVTKLPNGKLSTKGLGANIPDPKGIVADDDGVQWPVGDLKKDTKLETSLHYNEYIVYDTKQVRARYFMQLRFHYGK